MSHELTGLVVILALGIGAQWLAWRLHLPAILLLLLAGVAAGPLAGWIDPDQLFGNALTPGVSLGVAVILFEGGLSLRLAELGQGAPVVWRLVTIGTVVTWILSAAAAHYVVGLDTQLAVLVGAVLVVTGPTVIVPLLRQVRLRPNVTRIIKWEAILIDPLGAILAVLVYEGILIGTLREATAMTVLGLAKSLLFGATVGIGGAVALTFALRKYYVPDFLQSPLSLTAVGSVLLLANALQPESGLLAVTVMGIALGAQRSVGVRSILEFKENLRVLLISTLFVVLAARLELGDLAAVAVPGTVLLAVLVLLVRPLSVAASTLGSSLAWRERAMLMCIAPRGIVTAAVITIFALRLEQAGHTQAGILVPLVFFVIAGSIVVYSVPAALLARLLGVAGAAPQGLLILGAHPWARQIAKVLQAKDFRVVLVDSNYLSVRAARMDGLDAHYGNIVSEHLVEELDLQGIGRLVALTPNYAANALAAIHLAEIFGRAQVYQLAPEEGYVATADVSLPIHLRGRFLFAEGMSYSALTQRFEAGAAVKSTTLTAEFGVDEYRARYGESALPLFLIDDGGRLVVIATDNAPAPKAGQTLVSLVEPDGSARRPQGADGTERVSGNEMPDDR